MKRIILTVLVTLLSTQTFAAKSADSNASNVKSYSFTFKDQRLNKVVFKTSEVGATESEALKKAAQKCMAVQMNEYSDDDALDICANPHS